MTHSILPQILFCLFFAVAQAEPLLTVADLSQFKRTGRYAEVVELCGRFQRAYPKMVRCVNFGVTAEGRPMKALVVSAKGRFTAQAARAAHSPVLLIQGGIHGGEIDGKDAGFWWLREALAQPSERLKDVTVVFVPVFNIDGHERFGPHNRPNQVGPEEMGWRVTGQNINLNRDYTKADTPEMQAMLRLLNEWDPIVYADLHVTDGAQFQHAISLNFVPNHLSEKGVGFPLGNRKLIELAVALESNILQVLEAKGFQPLTLYPDFVQTDDPTSGFKEGISTPRFSHGYWGLRNRIGLLVETHSWKDYATRVRSVHDTIEALVKSAAQNGQAWMDVARVADEASAKSAAGSEWVLRAEASAKFHPIEFLGYAYRVEPSSISGQNRIIYDPSKKQVWKVPLFDDLQPNVKVILPKGGYIVEAAHAGWVAAKLKLHDIHYRLLKMSLPGMDVATFRSTAPQFGAKSYEGHQLLTVPGSWKDERRAVPSGSLYIPIAQARAGLIANLFEPSSDDSFLQWGFFNSHFEQKEYMENYVTEEVAENMLNDPSIRAEFSKRLKDKDFAKDPHQRLDFFYRKHPAWDERFGLYPVYRIEAEPH